MVLLEIKILMGCNRGNKTGCNHGYNDSNTIIDYDKNIAIFAVRPKKNICVFPVTRPTLIFPSDPKVFIGIPKK